MTTFTSRRLGQYQLLEKLGEGGMAVVYRARQESVARDVAIKIIRPDLAKSEGFVERFAREGRIVASLSHPNILKVFGFGQQDGYSFIVMELMTGGTLAQHLSKRPLSLDEVSRVTEQISSALDYAHSRGIIHRDLKPQNVLLDQEGNAYLTDFGIARLNRGTSAITQIRTLKGTPAYMSPEQWRGEKLDGCADVYALGIMLFKMVTGVLPFEKDELHSIMFQHLNMTPPSARKLRSNLRPGVDIVLQRALAKDRSQRYDTAGELAQDFKAALAGKRLTRPARSIPQAALIAGIGMALLLVVFGLASAFLLSRGGNFAATQTAIAAAQQNGGALALLLTSATDTPTAMPPTVTLTPSHTATENATLQTLVALGKNVAQQTQTAVAISSFTLTPTDTLTATFTASATFTISPTLSLAPSSTPTLTPTPIRDAAINASKVNLRSGPGYYFDSIAQLPKDTSLFLVGRDQSNTWYQIRTDKNATGWVLARYVTLFTDTNGLATTWTSTATPIPSPQPQVPSLAVNISVNNVMCNQGQIDSNADLRSLRVWGNGTFQIYDTHSSLERSGFTLITTTNGSFDYNPLRQSTSSDNLYILITDIGGNILNWCYAFRNGVVPAGQTWYRPQAHGITR